MSKRTSLTGDQTLLEAALEGLEAQRQRLEDQIRQVRAALGRRRGTATPALTALRKTKRDITPAGRKRIAAAQKKRWAEYRKDHS